MQKSNCLEPFPLGQVIVVFALPAKPILNQSASNQLLRFRARLSTQDWVCVMDTSRSGSLNLYIRPAYPSYPTRAGFQLPAYCPQDAAGRVAPVETEAGACAPPECKQANWSTQAGEVMQKM